jgi:hypothetical protein
MADRFSSKISASSPVSQTEKNADVARRGKSPARGFGLLWHFFFFSKRQCHVEGVDFGFDAFPFIMKSRLV